MRMIQLEVVPCILAVFLMGIASSAIAAPLDILVFKKAQFTQQQQQQICVEAKTLCSSIPEWRSVIGHDQTLWILSQDRIAQFTRSASSIQVLGQWPLAVSHVAEQSGNPSYIFPKLFPMSKNQYAVAVIHSASEMYSGGGANIERADFYALKPAGQTQKLMTDYPFSFNRMVRACFSEEDYNRAKGICHDEDGLSLEIRPIQPMLWQFRYRYNSSISPASDSGEQSYRGSRNLNIDLNRVPKQPDIPDEWNYAGIE